MKIKTISQYSAVVFFRDIRREADNHEISHVADIEGQNLNTRQTRTAREPKTGLPIKAEAWTIAKTATRNVRYLFMVNLVDFHYSRGKETSMLERKLMAAIVTDERRYSVVRRLHQRKASTWNRMEGQTSQTNEIFTHY